MNELQGIKAMRLFLLQYCERAGNAMETLMADVSL